LPSANAQWASNKRPHSLGWRDAAVQIRADTIAGYKPAITIYRGEKRRERREKKAGYRFIAGCNTDFKILCVYERWDQILMM
jgi:hypothetical protein